MDNEMIVLKWLFPVFLAALAVVHLVSCWRGDDDLRKPTKIALMPVVALTYLAFANTPSLWVVAGLLLGCLGGRLDHTVANLQLLSWLSAQGAQGVLLGEGEAAAVVTEGTLSFPASMEGFVSVFCAGGTARGVTLEGLKYPLDHAELTSDFPLGVSNEFVGLPARISVEEGSLLVAWEDRGTLDDLLPTLWSD